jgi:hypothetical protein
MCCALGPLLQTKTLVGDELADPPSIPVTQRLNRGGIQSEPNEVLHASYKFVRSAFVASHQLQNPLDAESLAKVRRQRLSVLQLSIG